MKKFYKMVVDHFKIILILFISFFLICAICRQKIAVNYDMNDYLPTGTASTVAMDFMHEEFGGGIPNGRVMIRNVTVPEALEYKQKLKAIDGVSDVTWLDNAVFVDVPLETIDRDIVDNYYIDENALFSITIEEAKRIEAVNAIREIIGEENAMSGNVISSAAAAEGTIKEVSKIAVIAVIFVLLVLIFTTTSWVEPFVIMLGLGVAIVINSGSNLIFGEISFVTNAAGNILQLAVSLDYSVFLLHRFIECRKETANPKEAMVNALTMSTSSILSSGLTTVIGFLALCLMQFQIGPDLGRALAKGISISLITVFVFMPVLFLKTYKWIDKFEHKPLLPSFQKFGIAVQKIMIPMVVLFLLIVVPSYLASNSNSYYFGASNIFGPNTKFGSDTMKIEEIFGKRDNYVLLVPKEDKATQKLLSNALHELPEVKSIISYVDNAGPEIPESYLDAETYSKLCSDTYTRMVISVETAYEGEKTFALVEKIRNLGEQYFPGQNFLAGEGVSTYDLMHTITADMVKVNLVAIGAVFVVLLFSLRSVILPTILVLSIETAVWINLSIPYFTDSSIFYIAYLIISSIQLGATVDYAILFTERYKESRESMDKKEAVINTITEVAVSILTSGCVLTVVGFLLGIISTHGMLSQLGFFLGKGTLCSLAIVLLVLPGLLYLFDRFFIKKKLKMEEIKNEA